MCICFYKTTSHTLWRVRRIKGKGLKEKNCLIPRFTLFSFSSLAPSFSPSLTPLSLSLSPSLCFMRAPNSGPIPLFFVSPDILPLQYLYPLLSLPPFPPLSVSLHLFPSLFISSSSPHRPSLSLFLFPSLSDTSLFLSLRYPPGRLVIEHFVSLAPYFMSDRDR